MARIALDSGAGAVTAGSPYNDTAGASVRDTQIALDSNLASLNTMLTELMNTRTVSWGTAAPSTGTHANGDIRWNTAPAAGTNIGWVCTGAGTPGTWKAFGVIEA